MPFEYDVCFSFVISPPSDGVKAFGYIEDGRFFGQFTYNGRTYFVDPLPRGQEGGNLVPFDEMKGLTGKLEPLLRYYSDYIFARCWLGGESGGV